MTEFEKIYADHFHSVFKYAVALAKNRDIAEEVTQETFFKALKKIDTFRGDTSMRVWLCQIAKNTYFSLLREAAKNDRLGDDERESDQNVESALVNDETAFRAHRLLHELKEPYKEVFTLRLFGELPFAQIGELFGKSESWARVTYHRAKMMLKENLNEN